jgi:hypothetical protein
MRTFNGLQIFTEQLTNSGQLDLRYVQINEDQEVIGEKYFSSGIRTQSNYSPAGEYSPGISGQIKWDNRYIYICVSGDGNNGRWLVSPLVGNWN